MKYIKIDKGDGSEKEITRKEALNFIKKNYGNPKYSLSNAEMRKGRINFIHRYAIDRVY